MYIMSFFDKLKKKVPGLGGGGTESDIECNIEQRKRENDRIMMKEME